MIRPDERTENKFPDEDPYLLAAAVLDTFHPVRLQPVNLQEDQQPGATLNLLSYAIVTRTGESRYEWRLPDEIRRKLLGTLSRHGMLELALQINERNADYDNPFQRMFDQYARRQSPALETQSLDELQGTLQAVRLLDGLVPGLPDAYRVTALVNREVFLQQFRTLATERYFGRKTEFKKLSTFVDTLPTSTLGAVRRGAVRFASRVFESLLHEPPFLVLGPGGIGKSAFLAKFFLDHVSATQQQRPLLFAYLDFDRTTLWPDEPMTILAELVRQIANQTTTGADAFMRLHKELINSLTTRSGYSADYDSIESIHNSNLGSRQLQRSLETFREVLLKEYAKSREISLLVVFDTFEEVTQRNALHLDTFWEFIRNLQKIVPRVRVVLSGRTELPKGLEHEKLILPPLKRPEVSEFLQYHGIKDKENIARIYERVGGHPLSLRLTIQLLQTMTARSGESLDMAARSSLFDQQWEVHLAEGVLYRRIISHIDDPKVKKLTDPGFVLREVTPEILLKVLNEPCGLKLQDLAEAEELFKALSNYSSLVSPRSQRTLRHRPEVRKMILASLQQSSPDLCRDIWRRAADYYASAGTMRQAAEEVYCRLMLNDEADSIMKRWRPGMEKFLASAREEVPERAKEILDYAMLVSESGRKTNVAAGSDITVLRLAEQMKLLLQRGRPQEALDHYYRHSRPGNLSPDLPLFVLVTRAMAQTGHLSEAAELAEHGLSFYAAQASYKHDRILDLLLLLCQMSFSASFKKTRTSAPLKSATLLWQYLQDLVPADDTSYQVFRLTVHILDLRELELEALNDEDVPETSILERVLAPPSAPPDDAVHAGCMARTFRNIESLPTEQENIDGLLHLRAFGLTGRYYPDKPAVRRLIETPVVRQLLRTEFGSVFERLRDQAQTVGRGTGELSVRLIHFIHSDAESRRSLDDEPSDRMLRLLAYVMQHEIRLRDARDTTAPGAHA
jgi:hypothetical protein